jgi:hypothetical protein
MILEPNQNMPVGTTHAALAAVLRGMADLVEAGDSLEGSIEYAVPIDEPPEVEVLVRASFRIGNREGQGGVRIIGTLGRTP